MNVAFTRARTKLIIFGSRETLQAAPLLEQFFTLLEGQNWILQLPKDADQLHVTKTPSPKKRSAESAEDGTDKDVTKKTPKKMRMSAFSDEGLLRGRPILKDLVNADR